MSPTESFNAAPASFCSPSRSSTARPRMSDSDVRSWSVASSSAVSSTRQPASTDAVTSARWEGSPASMTSAWGWTRSSSPRYSSRAVRTRSSTWAPMRSTSAVMTLSSTTASDGMTSGRAERGARWLVLASSEPATDDDNRSSRSEAPVKSTSTGSRGDISTWVTSRTRGRMSDTSLGPRTQTSAQPAKRPSQITPQTSQ